MRRWLILVAVLAGLASLVRHFPLAWAAASVPDGVADFSGTIWTGQATNVPLLNRVRMDGSLSGLRLDTGPGDVTLRGDISPGGVNDLVLSMPVRLLPTGDGQLAGLSGRVSLRVDEAVIADNQCASATGRASTDVLAANRARFDWAGPELSGPVDCADGRLRVRLSGEDAVQSVEATILSGLDGTYSADVRVTSRDPSAASVLGLFGFSPNGSGGYTLSEQGRWR